MIREEDIQIIRDWRSLDNGGPREVLRTDYGLGLEDIEGQGNSKGFPWWKFKPKSKFRISIMGINDLVELKGFPSMITARDQAPTNNQRAILSWILEQNWTADREAEATGIVQQLQARDEAEKEHARHMQRQAPKPPKKPT